MSHAYVRMSHAPIRKFASPAKIFKLPLIHHRLHSRDDVCLFPSGNEAEHQSSAKKNRTTIKDHTTHRTQWSLLQHHPCSSRLSLSLSLVVGLSTLCSTIAGPLIFAPTKITPLDTHNVRTAPPTTTSEPYYTLVHSTHHCAPSYARITPLHATYVYVECVDSPLGLLLPCSPSHVHPVLVLSSQNAIPLFCSNSRTASVSHRTAPTANRFGRFAPSDLISTVAMADDKFTPQHQFLYRLFLPHTRYTRAANISVDSADTHYHPAPVTHCHPHSAVERCPV